MAERPVGAAAEAPAPGAQALLLCDGRALQERGRAWGWDVQAWGEPARAFALRFDGRVHAYLNRCVHVAAELDWQPGEFLDAERRWILCSLHGAAYDPSSGRCVGGPCGRGRLQAIAVSEVGTQVYWYPSPAIQPVVDAGR
jgi:nitrite reductase/ring-hydroxylating ferredoxin subunit